MDYSSFKQKFLGDIQLGIPPLEDAKEDMLDLATKNSEITKWKV